MSKTDVIVIGAGAAGLAAAATLHQAGVSVLVVEAAGHVGGRMSTEEVDGFLLDRGFQVVLTDYPEVKRWFHFTEADFAEFVPGALVRYHDDFYHISDPYRSPFSAMGAVFSPLGSIADKVRIMRMKARLKSVSLDEIFQRTATSTRQYLIDEGFDTSLLDAVFRPFMGGVFLDRDLETTSRMFEFVFKTFLFGNAGLPAGGISALPKRLAARLPDDSIRLHTKVSSVSGSMVTLSTGETLNTKQVIIATDGSTASRLTNGAVPAPRWRDCTTLYFSAPEPPVQEPNLVLNGTGSGFVNSLVVPSLLHQSCAPAGHTLISVTVIGRAPDGHVALEHAIREELISWYGDEVSHWKMIKQYYVPQALPAMLPQLASELRETFRLNDTTLVCGDYLRTASLQGALESGRLAAEELLSARSSR